jgi:Na+/H+ antiporter NhaC
VLFTGAFVAFSTGSSWGTMSIVTPIAVPVAWNLAGTHTMVAAVVGTVFSGAIFGDHASPISDTTVLSATFTGADLIDHVRTQLYYATTVVGVAAALLVVWGYTRVTPWLLLPVGVLALVGLVYGLSELDASRRGIDAKQSSAPPTAPGDD